MTSEAIPSGGLPAAGNGRLNRGLETSAPEAAQNLYGRPCMDTSSKTPPLHEPQLPTERADLYDNCNLMPTRLLKCA